MRTFHAKRRRFPFSSALSGSLFLILFGFWIPFQRIMVRWNQIWQSFRHWYKRNNMRNESLEVCALCLKSFVELFGKGGR